jgi:hypothetical protein
MGRFFYKYHIGGRMKTWQKFYETKINETGDLAALEKQLATLNHDAATMSGMPGYPKLDAERKKILKQIDSLRPLNQDEYTQLYGSTFGMSLKNWDR